MEPCSALVKGVDYVAQVRPVRLVLQGHKDSKQGMLSPFRCVLRDQALVSPSGCPEHSVPVIADAAHPSRDSKGSQSGFLCACTPRTLIQPPVAKTSGGGCLPSGIWPPPLATEPSLYRGD